MRTSQGVALAALAALLLFGVFGTMFGAMLGAGEVRNVPAMLGIVAIMVLRDGPRALPAATGWAVLGAAGAVALRLGTGLLGENGWIPGEDTSRAERVLEAAWCLAVAVLAWRGGAGRWIGPLLATCVATTRIGGFGQALVPILFEPTLREALLLSVNLVAGFAAGMIVVMLAGWGVAILARLPARWAQPGRVLAALAAAAGIGHMLQV